MESKSCERDRIAGLQNCEHWTSRTVQEICNSLQLQKKTTLLKRCSSSERILFYKHQCTLHSKQRFTGCWIGDADGLAGAGALPLAVHIILEDVSVKYLLKDALPGHGAKAGGATATTPLALITRRFVRLLNFPGFRLFFLR